MRTNAFMAGLAVAVLAIIPFLTSASPIHEVVSGRILLQVEENGEAWYVYPETDQRYYLGRPADAFAVMRELGLGIRHEELVGYRSSGFPERLYGLILLDVEMNGEAYYVFPETGTDRYLGRPADAFAVMRELGLGISNVDLGLIPVSPVSATPVTADAAQGEASVRSIVDTGQTHCYGDSQQVSCPAAGADYAGQDAQYSGVQPDYRDNGDGTVTDLVTGLMWQQSPGGKMTYEQAVAAVGSFSLAGHGDWRLPTIKETYSLIDFSGRDPSGVEGDDTSQMIPFIDDGVFGYEYGDPNAGERVIDSQWGSSNLYVSTTGPLAERTLFGVNFADGRIKGYGLQHGSTEKAFFWLFVRGEEYGNNDFSDNGDGTVFDRNSGLVWQKADSGQGMDWKSALDHCEGLSLAGADDWRLPNAKELQGILDYGRSPDTHGTAAIDPAFDVSGITNEAGQADFPYYWTSTTHASMMGGNAGVYVSFGRAMGYMNGAWHDVHGAGAQRSDPKSGDPNDYPQGHGPQGDAIRIFNHVRCVRSGAAETIAGSEPEEGGLSVSLPEGGQSGNGAPTPPQEAIAACVGQPSGMQCMFQAPHGSVYGTCGQAGSSWACKP